MESGILLKILLAVGIGAVLGLETETRFNSTTESKKDAEENEKSKLGGVRTYTILAIFGAISGLFYLNGEYNFVYLMFLTVLGLILSAYIFNIKVRGAFGLTTEIAVMITFLLGFLCTSSILAIEVVFFLFVILAFFLSNKRGITVFTSRIQHEEISDVVKFGIISLVVLPLLPNRNFYINDFVALLNLDHLNLGDFNNFLLLNPFQIWFTVVLISGFTLLGYFLSKVIGRSKGNLLTGFFSGFISSTAATISFATRSKIPEERENTKLYIASTLLSKSSSFILLSVLLLINSLVLFESTLPFLFLLSTLCIIFAIVFIARSRNLVDNQNYNVKYQPFSIGPALKLVSIILIIRLVVQLLQKLDLDPTILIIFTSLSGATGVDAPSIAFAGLFESGNISLSLAVFAIVLTNLINFVAKAVFAKIAGSSDFFRKFGITLFVIMSISIVLFQILS